MGARRIHEDALKLAAALVLAALAGAAQAQPARASRADFDAVDARVADDATFDRLLAGLPVITLDDDGTRRSFYLWEGDMLMTAEQIRGLMFARKVQGEPARGPAELLLQVRDDGQPGYWQRGRRTLTWAADCTTFTDPAQCASARQLFAAAARDWVNSCRRCGISFREVPATGPMQPGAGTAPPTLVLRYQPDQFDYLAIAFFANDAPYKRFVSVTPGFFTTSFDRTGILRHELGHVLGYRHEHNRAPTGCFFEDNKWVALTPYDPKSVMHYFCGGGGSRALQLSASDIAGHRALYLKP